VFYIKFDSSDHGRRSIEVFSDVSGISFERCKNRRNVPVGKEKAIECRYGAIGRSYAGVIRGVLATDFNGGPRLHLSPIMRNIVPVWLSTASPH
jgi:hypothetical protein